MFTRRYEPWDVNVGAVVGRDGLLVVDTRATSDEADELLADLRRIDRRPPRWVVNTHDHFDHVGGNARFSQAQVWGHPSLAGTVPVGHPVAGRAGIDLGDRRVALLYLGPAHTAGDVVVAVPDAGVVFAGDLIEESGPPAYGDDSFPLGWPLAVARLRGLIDRTGPGTRVVPGHGEVVDRRFVVDQQAGLAAVARTIRSLWVGEVPVERALAGGAGRWPWPPDVLGDAVARGYRQLDGDAR